MKLVLSTLVTTWLSNIAFHLRPIWLQTLVAIDSESRQTSFQRHFKAFARRYLRSLCCSIGIWAEALSLDRSHFICDLFWCKLCLWARSKAPRTWPLILQSNPLIVFWNSLREWLPDDLHWSAEAQTWTQTWTLPPDQWVVVVLSALKPQNKVQ